MLNKCGQFAIQTDHFLTAGCYFYLESESRSSYGVTRWVEINMKCLKINNNLISIWVTQT